VRQTIIEMESAFLFVSAAGQGTCLAVLTTGDADIGLVAYEMAVLVRRSNEHLGVANRPPSHQPGHQSPAPGYPAQPNYPAQPSYPAQPGYSPSPGYQAAPVSPSPYPVPYPE
jgi:hypothetical protein